MTACQIPDCDGVGTLTSLARLEHTVAAFLVERAFFVTNLAACNVKKQMAAFFFCFFLLSLSLMLSSDTGAVSEDIKIFHHNLLLMMHHLYHW